MRLSILAIAALLATVLAVPAKAGAPERIRPATSTAQAQPTSKQVVEACTKNQAETLLNPFTDVSPNHWAFKAVMSMYYCGPGPFRATPSQSQQTSVKFIQPQSVASP